jgi:hypothetical protein
LRNWYVTRLLSSSVSSVDRAGMIISVTVSIITF